MSPRAITARTRAGCVLGWPVAHSASPAIQNAAFAELGIDAVFVALAVRPAEIGDAVRGLAALGFLGASVTVPHKEAARDLCDRLDDSARRVGAVNCLELSPEGGVVGHNTDAGGFLDALRAELGREPAGVRALLLGGGGAARAVAAGLLEEGASVEVIARRPERVRFAPARPFTPEALAAALAGADLVVDCTPTALAPGGERALPAEIPLAALPGDAVVASLVYHREPELLSRARARGLRTMTGAGMLVHQGARAFEIWTGRPAPIEAMRRALDRHLAASAAAAAG